jgi:hypothetical protein
MKYKKRICNSLLVESKILFFDSLVITYFFYVSRNFILYKNNNLIAEPRFVEMYWCENT